MTTHAHLSKNEVIGYLAGIQTLSKNSKPVLIIQKIYPCESITQKARNQNAEMCPESAVLIH